MQDEANIGYHHAALLRLVGTMFAAVGIIPGGPPVATMPGHVRAYVLRILTAAESATRRLIILYARRIVVKLTAKRAGPRGKIPKASGTAKNVPCFPLFDPRKYFAELAKSRRGKSGPGPRISGFDDDSWTPYDPTQTAKAAPDPTALCRRLQALMGALEDIQAQARRLARLQAKRKAAGEPIRRTEPRRPGPPPGSRARSTHEIDDILKDCDEFVLRAAKPPDRKDTAAPA